MNEYNEWCEKYFSKFGYSPDAEMGYVEPTLDDIKKAVETGVEIDFYKGMPEGAYT
jgi:hypothetical protein